MEDRVDKFLTELEAEIGAQARLGSLRPSLEAAQDAAGLLAGRLDVLSAEGVSFESLTSGVLRALAEEIRAFTGLDRLQQLAEKASALLMLVDDGMVDGDALRLRRAIERAELASASASPSPDVRAQDVEIDPRLVRVRCTTCSARVVGRRRPATTWEQMAEILSDHYATAHGRADIQLGALLGEAREVLRGGAHSVLELGQFTFTTLDVDDVGPTPNPTRDESGPAAPTESTAVANRTNAKPSKAFHDRAAQWKALPIGTRFARRSDPSITGEIVEGHGFLVQGRHYPFTGRGAPLSAAGGDISGTSENGWVTWVRIDE